MYILLEANTSSTIAWYYFTAIGLSFVIAPITFIFCFVLHYNIKEAQFYKVYILQKNLKILYWIIFPIISYMLIALIVYILVLQNDLKNTQ